MQSNQEKPLVVITGITGFVGAHVAYVFLKDGRFRVRGTVRDLGDSIKLNPVRKAFGEDLFKQMELVAANLLDEASIINAVKECTYVVHVASPVVINQPKDPMVLVKPAVEGTLNICKACRKWKVKRLVVTSSSAAIKDQLAENRLPILTEENWSVVEKNPNITPYSISKVKAERAAWDYQKSLPDNEKFELITLCPSWILGPAMCKPGFASEDAIKQILLGKFPVLKVWAGIVDVRDVAIAHLKAITIPEAANHRFIINNKDVPMIHVIKCLHDEFGKWYNFSYAPIPYWKAYVASFFFPVVRMKILRWDYAIRVDNTKSKTLLGMEYRDCDKTLVEMAHDLIDKGYIVDQRHRVKL